MITQEYLKELFDYKNGNLYWKVNRTANKVKGKKAGSLHHTGYYVVGINNKLYRLHRLIFLYHYGFLPKYVDHINRDKLNNNINNLREVTQSQNIINQKPKKKCSSKYKGVTYHKRDNCWQSTIRINGKKIYLGSFKLEKEAAEIYNKAAIKYHGEYICLNEVI